jgi:hypothetical protein
MAVALAGCMLRGMMAKYLSILCSENVLLLCISLKYFTYSAGKRDLLPTEINSLKCNGTPSF